MKGIRDLIRRTPAVVDDGKQTKMVPLQKASEMHKQLALLVALGWRTKDIAEELGIVAPRVSFLKSSPAVMEHIQRYRRAIDEKSIIEGIAHRLNGEFHASMDKLATLRDEGEEETTQLGAAKFLVEKAVDVMVPKKTQVEETKKVGVVVLGVDDIGRLRGVLEEAKEALAGAIEIEGKEVENGSEGFGE